MLYFKRIGILQCPLSGHKGIQLKINKKQLKNIKIQVKQRSGEKLAPRGHGTLVFRKIQLTLRHPQLQVLLFLLDTPSDRGGSYSPPDNGSIVLFLFWAPDLFLKMWDMRIIKHPPCACQDGEVQLCLLGIWNHLCVFSLLTWEVNPYQGVHVGIVSLAYGKHLRSYKIIHAWVLALEIIR